VVGTSEIEPRAGRTIVPEGRRDWISTIDYLGGQ
jgi:hypothetical protein